MGIQATLKNDRVVTGMNGIRSRSKYNLPFGAFRYCKSPQEKGVAVNTCLHLAVRQFCKGGHGARPE